MNQHNLLFRAMWILMAGSALCLTGCATDQAVVSQANQFDTSLKPAEIKNSEVNDYFQSIGRRIQESAKEADAAHWGPKTHFSGGSDQWMFQPNMEFHLVNSKTLNAFTTGGNHVYIYNELFQWAQSHYLVDSSKIIEK